jgi:hypothetical protein
VLTLGCSQMLTWFKYRLDNMLHHEWRTDIFIVGIGTIFNYHRWAIGFNLVNGLSRAICHSPRLESTNQPIQSYTTISRSAGWNKSFFSQIYGKKRSRHYEKDIRPVFEEWSKHDFHTVNYSYKNLTPANIPLYLDVIDNIDKCDKHREALPHLKSYPRANSIYHLIRQLENEHNNYVSNVYTPIERHFFDKIDGNDKIKIKERNESTEFGKYYKNVILNYFRTTSINSSQSKLKIEFDHYHANGKNYSRIQVMPDNSDIVVGDRISVDALHKIMLGEENTMISQFRKMQASIADMNIRCNHFSDFINKIIYETDRCKLKGRCIYENKFFPYNISKFFKWFRLSKNYRPRS